MKKTNKTFLFIAILVAAAGSAIGYLAVNGYFLREINAMLGDEISKTDTAYGQAIKNLNLNIRGLKSDIESKNGQIDTLEKTIDQIEEDLQMTQDERDAFEKKYKREKARMNEFNSQIDDLLGSVGDLEQLEATDDELLMKYSKVYFLNENYLPESLAAIDPEYTVNTGKEHLLYSKIIPFLNDMIDAAESDGINLRVVSSYRSFAEQASLKSAYTMTYGSGANQFSADQGYSEHQLGTAVDLSTSELGANFTGFDQSAAYAWLNKNAYKYGFVISYPKNNSYYQYEPWHWRFVGRKLADKLHEDGKNFYDMDQRDIDEYQISFFD
jgi:zinc D-Ala-D-Ala carboxypeptidase